MRHSRNKSGRSDARNCFIAHGQTHIYTRVCMHSRIAMAHAKVAGMADGYTLPLLPSILYTHTHTHSQKGGIINICYNAYCVRPGPFSPTLVFSLPTSAGTPGRTWNTLSPSRAASHTQTHTRKAGVISRGRISRAYICIHVRALLARARSLHCCNLTRGRVIRSSRI